MKKELPFLFTLDRPKFKFHAFKGRGEPTEPVFRNRTHFGSYTLCYQFHFIHSLIHSFHLFLSDHQSVHQSVHPFVHSVAVCSFHSHLTNSQVAMASLSFSLTLTHSHSLFLVAFTPQHRSIRNILAMIRRHLGGDISAQVISPVWTTRSLFSSFPFPCKSHINIPSLVSTSGSSAEINKKNNTTHTFQRHFAIVNPSRNVLSWPFLCPCDFPLISFHHSFPFRLHR